MNGVVPLADDATLMAAYDPSALHAVPRPCGVRGRGLDLVVGLLLLLTAPMLSAGDGMAAPPGYAGGILLLLLGGAVLTTAIYMSATSMAANRRALGPLMLLYGLVMLFVGVAMIARWFPMMPGSDLSAGAMIVVGLGMLYSGAAMGKA